MRANSLVILLSSLGFCLHGSALADTGNEPSQSDRSPGKQGLLIVISDNPTSPLAKAASSHASTHRVLVLRPEKGALDADLRNIQRAADSADTTEVLDNVSSLAATLKSAGLNPAEIAGFDQATVVSNAPVPIDLLDFRGEPLGLHVQFNHVIVSDDAAIKDELARGLKEEIVPLQKMVLLAAARLPRNFRRSNHDAVKAALSVADRLPTDIVVAPHPSQSLAHLQSPEAQILHIDTHGASDSILLGTPGGPFLTSELPQVIRPSLVLVVGCATGSSAQSSGPVLFTRGAKAVVGSAFAFRSGDPTGGRIDDSTFYDVLWAELLRGRTVGEAIFAAKRALPKNIWSASWLLFGNSNLRFRAAGE